MLCAQSLRQLLISISLTICCLSDGFIVGQMSGMIDALKFKDSSISLTDDDISWIASSINIVSVIGVFIVGMLMEVLGRKKTFTIVNLPLAACWVLIFFAHDKSLLFITKTIQALCFGGILMLIATCVAEYRPPKDRALWMTLIASVGSLVGTTIGHMLSISMNWRHVALIGVVPSGLSVILPLFWVESPSWLAARGRFEESDQAFKALHIPSEASNNELRLLLAFERTKRSELTKSASKVTLGRKIVLASKQRYFWKLLLFSIVLCAYKVASGRILFSTLAITMLQDITGTPDILLFTLFVDGLSIFGAIISCFFLSRFKVRGLLFISGGVANVILVILGLCLYIFTNNPYTSWTKVSLLGLYFITIMAGPYPILDTLNGEIFPLELKSFFLVVTAFTGGSLQFLSIKLIPNILPVMGYHGIFLLNAAMTFLCLLYLWFYMPESRGRSLQEIEYFFKNNTFNYSKELFKSEQTNEMLNKNIAK